MGTEELELLVGMSVWILRVFPGKQHLRGHFYHQVTGIHSCSSLLSFQHAVRTLIANQKLMLDIQELRMIRAIKLKIVH